MKSIAYVGIDAHKDTHTICVIPAGSKEPFLRQTYIANKKVIQEAFRGLSDYYDLRCCYEASSCGYVLYRWLTEIGVACQVVAPSMTPVRPGEHVKTDRRDALKLARLYAAGQLTPIRVPTEFEQSVRGLTRLREAVVRDVVLAKTLLNQFLRDQGRVFDGKSRWTQSYWRWLRNQSFSKLDNFVFTEYLGMLEFKLARLQEIEIEVQNWAQTDIYKSQVHKLCSLRGIGIVTAMTLVTEIIDFKRFASASSLMAFLGLVPSENSSGKRQNRFAITKAGNARCRRVLVESAWKYARRPALCGALKERQEGLPSDLVAHSWKAQQRLFKKYWSIASRKEKGKAIVAVARELVGFIWAIMNWPPQTAAAVN
jgi:transposase